MITIEEVIEQCAKEIEPKEPRPCDCWGCESYEYCGSSKTSAVEEWDTRTESAATIRALVAQYEGCIVAERPARMSIPTMNGDLPLYRARETQR